MNTIKNRFLIYAIIGLLFGVLDWFYLDWLAHLSWGSLGQSVLVIPLILLMNYGIWLVPVIPIGIHEARRAVRGTTPALASALTWFCAMLGYYGYYTVLLSLGKLPHLEYLNVFAGKYTTFWLDYWKMFQRVILSQFLEWSLIALVAGSTLGALLYRFFHKS